MLRLLTIYQDPWRHIPEQSSLYLKSLNLSCLTFNINENFAYECHSCEPNQQMDSEVVALSWLLVCLILDTLWDYPSTRMSILADTSVGNGHAVAFRTNYLWSLQKSGAHPPQCVTMYKVNTTVVCSLLALLQTVAKSNSYPASCLSVRPSVCPHVREPITPDRFT